MSKPSKTGKIRGELKSKILGLLEHKPTITRFDLEMPSNNASSLLYQMRLNGHLDLVRPGTNGCMAEPAIYKLKV